MFIADLLENCDKCRWRLSRRREQPEKGLADLAAPRSGEWPPWVNVLTSLNGWFTLSA